MALNFWCTKIHFFYEKVNSVIFYGWQTNDSKSQHSNNSPKNHTLGKNKHDAIRP